MNITWKSCFRLCASLFILFCCIFYWQNVSSFISVIISAVTPILSGLAIAYVLNILMSFYERHYFKKNKEKKFVKKTRRAVCLIGAILTLLAIIGLVVGLVVPELARCVKFLISEVPPLIEKFLKIEWVRELLPQDVFTEISSINWTETITKMFDTLKSGVGNALGAVMTAISSIFSIIVTTFMAIIFSVYLLTAKEKLSVQLKKVMGSYLPLKIISKISHVTNVLDECFHGFIVGQCTEAIILGVLCSLGMAIFRFPYWGMIGALVGFTALIPVAGAYIGAAVGAIMMLTESPLKALLFLVFIIVLQQLEGTFIYPKVVGKSIGLPALFVLGAVSVGGSLFGILGMLVGVPLCAAVYRLVKEDVKQRDVKTKNKDEVKTVKEN